jgi:hypothetical protein
MTPVRRSGRAKGPLWIGRASWSTSRVLTWNEYLAAENKAQLKGRLKDGSIDIKVRAFREDDVEMLFSDDGFGMNASVQHQAFNPFFMTRPIEAAPVSDCISSTISRLGGTLSLDSEPTRGHGSR